MRPVPHPQMAIGEVWIEDMERNRAEPEIPR